jgi:hypothetical protein
MRARALALALLVSGCAKSNTAFPDGGYPPDAPASDSAAGDAATVRDLSSLPDLLVSRDAFVCRSEWCYVDPALPACERYPALYWRGLPGCQYGWCCPP